MNEIRFIKCFYKTINVIMLIVVILVSFSLSQLVEAHSGRTDSNGGHKDNKNVSGLGSYHYHHGYGPHLHPDGVCPYATTTSSSTSSQNTNSNNTSTQSSNNIKEVEKVEISTVIPYLELGGEMVLSALVSPSNATNKSLVWESSNSEILKLEGSKVISVGLGNADILAKSKNGKSSKISIEVIPRVNDLKIEECKDDIYVNDELKLNVILNPLDLPLESLKWSSNNSRIARVNPDGTVIPLQSGNVIIKCQSLSGVEDEISLDIFSKIISAELTENEITIKVNESQIIPVKVVPKDSSVKFVKWVVNNPKLLHISEDGEIIALEEGTTTVYAIINRIAVDSMVVKVQAMESEGAELINQIKLDEDIATESKNTDNKIDGLSVFVSIGLVIVLQYMRSQRKR